MAILMSTRRQVLDEHLEPARNIVRHSRDGVAGAVMDYLGTYGFLAAPRKDGEMMAFDLDRPMDPRKHHIFLVPVFAEDAAVHADFARFAAEANVAGCFAYGTNMILLHGSDCAAWRMSSFWKGLVTLHEGYHSADLFALSKHIDRHSSQAKAMFESRVFRFMHNLLEAWVGREKFDTLIAAYERHVQSRMADPAQPWLPMGAIVVDRFYALDMDDIWGPPESDNERHLRYSLMCAFARLSLVEKLSAPKFAEGRRQEVMLDICVPREPQVREPAMA